VINIIEGFCKVKEDCDGNHSHIRGSSDVVEDTDQRRLRRMSFPIRLIGIPDARPLKIASDLLRLRSFETAENRNGSKITHFWWISDLRYWTDDWSLPSGRV